MVNSDSNVLNLTDSVLSFKECENAINYYVFHRALLSIGY